MTKRLYLKEHHLDLTKPVDIDGWERFEELADENPDLWDIFWCLSKDKPILKKSERCGVEYFENALMPNVYSVMRKMWLSDDLNMDDVQIIMSLFVAMIPKEKCKTCDCKPANKMSYVNIR